LSGTANRAIAADANLSKSTVWQIVARKGVYQEREVVDVL
jgi:hypothetical protein